MKEKSPPPQKAASTRSPMVSCPGCYRQFANAQGLGGHRLRCNGGYDALGGQRKIYSRGGFEFSEDCGDDEWEDVPSEESNGDSPSINEDELQMDNWFSLQWLQGKKMMWRQQRRRTQLLSVQSLVRDEEPKCEHRCGSAHRTRRNLKEKVDIGDEVAQLILVSTPLNDAYKEVAALRRVSKSNVQKWYKKLEVNRDKLYSAKKAKGIGRGKKAVVFPDQRWKGKGAYPEMEKRVYERFLKAREQFHKVSPSSIRYWARKEMRLCYPNVTLLREGGATIHQKDRGKESFLMSDGWLRNFKKRHFIRRRKKTNGKVRSAAEKQPECERFVKGLQKRKRRYKDNHQCKEQGRWSAENQYNGDEMPLVLENGSYTLEDCRPGPEGRAKSRVQIKSGGGKHRFCSLVGFLRFKGKQVCVVSCGCVHVSSALFPIYSSVFVLCSRTQSPILFLKDKVTYTALKRNTTIQKSTFIFNIMHGVIGQHGEGLLRGSTRTSILCTTQ